MLLMIDNYDSFTYNIVQYFGELGQEVKVFRNDAITLAEIARLQPQYLVISLVPAPRHKPASRLLRSVNLPARFRCSASVSAIRPSAKPSAGASCMPRS